MGEPTKTPRTDSEAFWIGRGEDRKQYQGGEYVRAAVARSIETELADARAALRDVFASDGSEGIYDAVKLYAARERGRNFLAKQG